MVRMAVLEQAGGPVSIRDYELPEMSATDVHVKVVAAGVCHSDLSFINGTVQSPMPVVLGHEASGIVIEVGDEVTNVAAGDHVILNWAPPCRECWFCTHDEPWLCSTVEKAGAATQFTTTPEGEPVYKALGVGAFAEEVVLPGHAVVPIPEDMDLTQAALMGCAVLTGVGAANNTAKVQEGQTVLVLGLGGIGLSTIAGAKLAGAAKIIAADVNADKEQLARTLGATDFIVSTDKLAKDIRALTNGLGVDHAFECVGKSATIKLAWKSTRRGGECTVVGVGRADDQVSLSAMEIFHFNRTLRSSVFGSSDPARDIPKLIEEVRQGNLDLATMITHRIGLKHPFEGFEHMKRAEGARTVIVME